MGSLKAQFPGTSQRIGRRAANSARCRASISPINLSGLKILVLRGGALGDLILTLPVLREIRKSYPDAEMVLLGIVPQARLAAAGVRRSSRAARCAGSAAAFHRWAVAAGRPKQAARIRSGDQFFVRSGCGHCTESGSRRGETGRSMFQSGSGPMFTQCFTWPRCSAQLGLTLHDPVPKLAIGSKPAQSSRLGFHVGSGSPQKNWPIDHWIELISDSMVSSTIFSWSAARRTTRLFESFARVAAARVSELF